MKTTEEILALSEAELLAYVLKGDAAAMAFVSMFCDVLHIWDDFEDGDKPCGKQEVSNMMLGALVMLPRNSFYQQHFATFSPLIESAILSWHTANAMERTDAESDRPISFIVRSDYINIMLMAARIVGGWSWALNVAPDLRRYWHREGFDGYLASLEHQFQLSKGA